MIMICFGDWPETAKILVYNYKNIIHDVQFVVFGMVTKFRCLS